MNWHHCRVCGLTVEWDRAPLRGYQAPAVAGDLPREIRDCPMRGCLNTLVREVPWDVVTSVVRNIEDPIKRSAALAMAMRPRSRRVAPSDAAQFLCAHGRTLNERCRVCELCDETVTEIRDARRTARRRA